MKSERRCVQKRTKGMQDYERTRGMQCDKNRGCAARTFCSRWRTCRRTFVREGRPASTATSVRVWQLGCTTGCSSFSTTNLARWAGAVQRMDTETPLGVQHGGRGCTERVLPHPRGVPHVSEPAHSRAASKGVLQRADVRAVSAAGRRGVEPHVPGTENVKDMLQHAGALST